MVRAVAFPTPDRAVSQARMASPPIVEGRRLLKKIPVISERNRNGSDASPPWARRRMRQRITLERYPSGISAIASRM
jgi:hypothetical protein